MTVGNSSMSKITATCIMALHSILLSPYIQTTVTADSTITYTQLNDYDIQRAEAMGQYLSALYNNQQQQQQAISLNGEPILNNENEYMKTTKEEQQRERRRLGCGSFGWHADTESDEACINNGTFIFFRVCTCCM